MQHKISILKQLCTILNDMHRKGVVHNDIKETNICICEGPTDLQVTLIDFGLSMATGTNNHFD